MLISISNLSAISKIQKNTLTKMRPVGLINILNTKEWKNMPPFYESGQLFIDQSGTTLEH